MNAVFSDDRVYRYALTRDVASLFAVRPKEILFVMLNPSTADEYMNDPTVRRCIDFATLWGYTTLTVCNLFALRSTDPKLLYGHPDPVGPENDPWIIECASRADAIVAAWGTHGALRERGDHVLSILSRFGIPHCLGFTGDGQPKHPLYLARVTQLEAMPPRVRSAR